MASRSFSSTSDWLICTACGTQFPSSDRTSLTTCFICDDPRQYTFPSCQAFTTLSDLRATHRNKFYPYANDARLCSIVTEPKFGIGQRAILIRGEGNTRILWDCITLLDGETIARIQDEGGLDGIVISHPHYYSTHLEWARAFDCPVYLAAEDKQWTTQKGNQQVYLTETETKILGKAGQDTGVRAIKLGGHFPGSLVLLFDGHLLIADTLLTTPAGTGNWRQDAVGAKRKRPAGMNTFAFMWSIPNFIPLPPSEISRMWAIIKAYKFHTTHGAFVGQDIEDDEAGIRQRVLESMQIQVRNMGWTEHPILKEHA